MDLFDVISNDIKEAMKAKDKVKLETLRNVKKFFLEAKTAPGANDTLTDDAALKIKGKIQPPFTKVRAAPTWLKPNWPKWQCLKPICPNK